MIVHSMFLDIQVVILGYAMDTLYINVRHGDLQDFELEFEHHLPPRQYDINQLVFYIPRNEN